MAGWTSRFFASLAVEDHTVRYVRVAIFDNDQSGRPSSTYFGNQLSLLELAIHENHLAILVDFLGCARCLWAEVDAAEGAGSGDVEEPWVDAFGVEAVVTWEDALVLSSLKVLGADAAALRVGVCGLARRVGASCGGCDAIFGWRGVGSGHWGITALGVAVCLS